MTFPSLIFPFYLLLLSKFKFSYIVNHFLAFKLTLNIKYYTKIIFIVLIKFFFKHRQLTNDFIPGINNNKNCSARGKRFIKIPNILYNLFGAIFGSFKIIITVEYGNFWWWYGEFARAKRSDKRCFTNFLIVK